MFKKNNKFILIVFVLFIITNGIFYYSYLNEINKYHNNELKQIESFESITKMLHTQDSIIYKSLLKDEINQIEKLYSSQTNNNFSSIIKTLSIQQSPEIATFPIESSLDNYFELKKIGIEITSLHKTQLISSQQNYDKKINSLLSKYDELATQTLTDLENEVSSFSQKRKKFKEYQGKEFFQKFILSVIISLTIVFIFSIKPKTKSNILDSDCQKILNFVNKEIKSGNFPTIKELKKELNLTHPTIQSKLKELENHKLIKIKKQGRNKHIFLS